MSSFRPFNLIKDGYIADIVSTTLVYHGFYSPDPTSTKTTGGALDTAIAQFMVAKEVKSAGGDTTSMKWAVDSGLTIGCTYNQIWNNRATLTYL